MNKRLTGRMVLLVTSLIVLSVLCARAQSLAPLGVQDAHLHPVNSGEIRLGGSYSDDLHNLFQSEDVNRRVTALPSLALSVGLGDRIEGQIDYSWLHLKRSGQEAEWGSGDLAVRFKVGLHPECRNWPAIALLATSKLPNADDRRDFGTDEADNTFELLLTRSVPGMTIHVNMGLGILGDPINLTRGQDDLMTYGLGLQIPLEGRGVFLFGLQGQDFGENTNKRGALQAGFQIPLGRATWDIGATYGYARRSEEWSIRTGLTLPIRIPRMFQPYCTPDRG